ncbi:MAG TPA: glycosyltransferase family 4 protein [Thermoanaerobaculia bacterium]|nr:glycosyltransferase family 4 protein [Thermoanaerobaculia bacterium]
MTVDPPLRLLWLTENYPPDRGGMAQSCDRIVRSLRRRGIWIDLVHFTRRQSEWQVEANEGGSCMTCPISEDPATLMNRLWAVLRTQENGTLPATLVAFGGFLPMLGAPVIAAWLRKPLLTLIRGNDFDASVFSPRRREILRYAVESSSLVSCVTRDQVRRLQALFPRVTPEWIPNGIELESWQLTDGDRRCGAEWRDAHVPPGRRLLGLFGHLKQKKGATFFLDQIRRSGRADRFHLLLSGDAEPPVHEWLERHGAEISFSLLPFMDRYELLPFYSACDLVALPSFYDGLPNVLLEAASLGIPILASNAGGMADLLVDGANAIVFDAADTTDCRRALEIAATIPPGELEGLASEARRRVTEELTAELEATRYLRLLGVEESATGAPHPFIHEQGVQTTPGEKR